LILLLSTVTITLFSMTTYKALILSSFDQPITLQSLPIPIVNTGSVLVQPLYAGLQSYSRAVFTGKVPYPLTLPQTPGTSAIARVEAVGPDATSVKPGDIVWVEPTISARDDPDTQLLLGFHAGVTPAANKLMRDVWRNGCYGEKLLIPLENAHVLPQSLFAPKSDAGRGYSFKDLATLSNVMVAFGGLDSAGVGAGSTVIVAPATGKFSGGAVLAALATGAKVIAASRNEDAMKKLYAFPGAKERLVTVKTEGNVEKDTAALLKATSGGASVFIDFSPPQAAGPTTPSQITSGINALRRNGQALLMGGLPTDVSFPYLQLMLKNITVRGKFMYERELIKRFIRMLENGNLVLGEEVGLSVGGVFGLDDIEEALAAAEESTGWGGDILLAPNGEQ
jgi:NADPH:quinone reductase-like Zn-dependent oxidoreductase